ncbi:hypothetical protein [Rhodococcus sp. 24CO]|uniref:hypothetical protein n=1 Tax=Rhodococcus sp. 24CO TaxID=3117460 RepID=UPI003D330488
MLRTVFIEVPFRVAATLRGARVFHPYGLVVQGQVEFDSTWWPSTLPSPQPLIARLSGGIGTPSGLPDVLGLALKLSDGTDEWDILLASSGTSTATRVLPLPAAGWSSAQYSSLMPYEAGETLRWVLAIPVGTHPTSTSVAALMRAIAKGPLRFDLGLASPTGEVVPAGHLSLFEVRQMADEAHPDFDPVLNCPPELVLRPRWLSAARIHAYRGSRQGRATARPDSPSPGRDRRV